VTFLQKFKKTEPRKILKCAVPRQKTDAGA